MYSQAEKTKDNKSRTIANSVTQNKSNGKQGFGFVDNRPVAKTFNNLQNLSHSTNIQPVVQAVFNYDPPSIGKEWANHLQIENDAQVVQNAVEKLHDQLIENNEDVAQIHAAIQGHLPEVTPDNVQQVKTYNFNSHGIFFTVENYQAWLRLAAGNGTMNDLRYIKHELFELGLLVAQEQGLNFLGEEAWDEEMEDKFEDRYEIAHAGAIGDEIESLAAQLNLQPENEAVTWQQVAVAIPNEEYFIYYVNNTEGIELPEMGDDINAYEEALEQARVAARLNLAVPDNLGDRLAELLEQAL